MNDIIPKKFLNIFDTATYTQKLDLHNKKITTIDLKKYILPFLEQNTNITQLNLSFNRIDSERARVLTQNNTITTLNLSHNDIYSIGARALAQNNKIKFLNLERNKINLYGIKHLVKNYNFLQLDLYGNDIDKEELKKNND